MKKFYFSLIFIFLVFSCKNFVKSSDLGAFSLVNYSNKEIEFFWITPEGELFPTVKNINIGYGQSFELNGLESGIYDIAIDFKNEYNSLNSKKDKNLCLNIEKGIKKVWIINPSGKIEIH
jgi:hypothetical protein